MARNAEKAMTTLARWRAAQVQEAGGLRERRPYLASECSDLPQAEKWRLQIVREIAKKVAQIQNVPIMDDITPEAAVLSPKPQSPREPSVKSVNAPINDLAGPELEAQPEFYAVPAIPSQQSAAPSKGSQKSAQPPVATSPRTSVRSEPIPIPAAATPNASVKSSSVRNPSPTKVDQKSRKSQPSLTSLSKPGPARQPSLNKEPRSISPESIARKMSSPARSSLARSPGRLVSLKNELETKLPEAVRYKTASPTGTLSNKPDEIKEDAKETIANLEPQGKRISDHIEQLNESVKALSGNMFGAQSPVLDSNIDKIANMSKILTDEANALRNSIKHLSEDIARTEDDIGRVKDVTDFPYHLFLLELIVNKIQMKCDCFDMDCNNLVIAATFLGKHPIILYDSNNGSVEDFFKINVGKSILFAMTYDKICSIEEFEIVVELSKQPPCSHCVTKLGLSRMDFTKEFLGLRDDLCKKWTEEQPKDNIICTTSTPLFKNQFYLSCGEGENPEAIGVIEVSVRMSFLGKEITTAFSAAPKPKGTSYLLKEGNGMTLYSCQKVEMDDQGKILLDEDAITKRAEPHYRRVPLRSRSSRSDSPVSQYSAFSRPNMPPQRYMDANPSDGMHRFDEIFTKMNDNELKIRVPKSTKVERIGKYDKIQELCECEDTPYNTGDQIHFELPSDIRKSDNTYTSNLKYSINPPSRNYDSKDRKIVNITPTNCPVPVNMEKRYHPQKDVFILKIGKKMESKDKKTDLEIELVTPKAPSAVPVENNNMSQQVSNSKLTCKTSKKKDKGKKKSKTSLKKKKSNTKTGKAKKKGKK